MSPLLLLDWKSVEAHRMKNRLCDREDSAQGQLAKQAVHDRNIKLLKRPTTGNTVSQGLAGALIWLTIQKQVLETNSKVLYHKQQHQLKVGTM